MKGDFLEILERQELIQKLVDQGFSDVVEALLMNENKCYTKKGRLNKSGACRVLGWKTKELEDTLLRMRDALREEVEED